MGYFIVGAPGAAELTCDGFGSSVPVSMECALSGNERMSPGLPASLFI